MATEISAGLLEIGAVKLQPNDPFTWASGIKSPIYTDNRQTIGYPKVRSIIAQGLATLIKNKFPDVEVIGGVATAGIPHAALVADILDLPMIYVRAQPKDHGAKKQLEGYDVTDKKVVLIDDLISTGGSVLGAAKAVTAEGGNMLGVAAIFTYELPKADENFAAQGLEYFAVTNYSNLIHTAANEAYVSHDDVEMLTNWRNELAK
ncbi:orotate phosphoribosyltransferase [Periweissella ghanensis]|nr:orotate phosphoribosyltransferase [Periweissella ghanensis]